MSGDQRDQPIIFYSEEITKAKQILIQQKRDHSMSDILFHVYNKQSEVIAHTLTVEELEEMLKADKGQGFGKGQGPNLSGKEVDVNPFTKTGQEQSKEDKYDKFSKLKV